MDREILLNALRRTECDNHRCLGCGHEHHCSTHGCAINRAAADLIEQQAAQIAEQERPPNAPLTLEELREMDGEPVWGVFPGTNSRYMIIQWHNSEFFKTFECGFLLNEEYGKTWLAYRRKPDVEKPPDSPLSTGVWADHFKSRFERLE